MSKCYAVLALLVAVALLSGGLTHALVEHSHGSELAADLLHAPLSGDSRYLFLILAASFLVLEFLLLLPQLVPVTLQDAGLLASLSRRGRALRRSVHSVYE